MDGERFDRLTKHLAAGASRRRVLGSLAGAVAAAAGATARSRTEAAPKNKACNVGCASLKGQQKNACMQACRDCGGNFDRVCVEEGPFGPVSFSCCAEGTFCVFGEGICCAEGTEPCFGPEGAVCCDAGTFCDFETGQCGPPAACDASSGCFGGTCAAGCFCVSSVEGDGACVSGEFANCDAPQCGSSADCGEGGVCVDATDCCGFPTVICFPAEAICQAGGASGRSASPGWNR